jgi:SEC-C motif-containing protein
MTTANMGRSGRKSADRTTTPAGGAGASPSCPCGSGSPYRDCCGPLHERSAFAPTAARLMRSRYSAFALGRPQYLLDTWHPSTRPPTLELDPQVRWTRLEILGTTGGSLLEQRGTVEFRAGYRLGRQTGEQHENSRFLRVGARWLYLSAV